MTKRLLYVMIFCIIGSISAASEFEMKEKLKTLMAEKKKGQRVVIDNSFKSEISEYLRKNQHVPVKNFKTFRLAAFASRAIVKDLNEKYKSTADDYRSKITDKDDRETYRIGLKILQKDYYGKFYICKGEDERKVKESWGKVDKLRDQIIGYLKNDARAEYSDTVIQLNEKIIEECRFEGAEYSLLTAYRARGENDEAFRKKYNELMLRMILDDGVNFDYLNDGLDSKNTSFKVEYLLFFTNVNSLRQKLILSKEQVEVVARAVLDKHSEVFNISNYYSEKEAYDEYAISDVIQSMVNLSTWLRHYQMNDLNEKIIKSFFDNKFVMGIIKENKWFKDYKDYLFTRMDFHKYKE